jgi:putative transposase
MPDHVHMMISIPPKYAVSEVAGYINGKSAIHLTRVRRAQAEFCGAALLGGGYMVSMVGRDEAVNREYIRNQEQEDRRLDQLDLWK